MLCFSVLAFAEEKITGSSPGSIPTTTEDDSFLPYQETTVTSTAPQKTNVYKNTLRELNRQYDEGMLTETEYIQRRRELDEMGY